MKIISRIGFAVAAAIAVSVAVPSAADAASGQLDPSFSGDGKVATDFTSGFESASSVAIQPDGKIVAAGSSRGGSGFVVARYNANGSLDSSFDGNGKAAVRFTDSFEFANSVAIQPDGKIVLAGFANVAGDGGFALARLNANGSLDSSFGGDGKVTTGFTTGFDFANSVAIQPDGKIVAAGDAAGKGRQFAFARYNANGSLDTSFDGNGKAAVNFTNASDSAAGVAIQPDGKIVAAGEAAGGDGQFALARLDANGSLDSSFGGDGKVATNFNTSFDFATDVAIQPDGKIVAAGDAAGGGGQFAFARYNANGSLDSSFDGNGKAAVNFTTGFDDVDGVVIQPDGKIVAAGFTPSRGGQFALARLNTNGSLDASFDGNGKLATDFTTGDDFAADVAIQPDGKIVAAGGAAGSGGRFALARYLAD